MIVTHPNRDKPEAHTARLSVIALLAVSILLMVVILAGGWSVLEGMLAVSFAYAIVYGVLIWRVSDWARGPLVVGAALATILAIFCAIAVPTWADREGSGYSQPGFILGGDGLSSGLLGLLTMLLLLVQLLLIGASLWAFRQEWQVEVETPGGGLMPDPGEGLPAPGTV